MLAQGTPVAPSGVTVATIEPDRNPGMCQFCRRRGCVGKKRPESTRKRVGQLAKSVAVGIATLVAILGIAFLEGAFRYSVILYVAVAFVGTYWVTTVLTTWRQFRRQAGEMRSLLVPELIPRANVSDLSSSRRQAWSSSDHPCCGQAHQSGPSQSNLPR